MRDLSRNEKGALAEAEAEAAARKAGYSVYRPTSGHSRADMILENDKGMWRVQVKWASIAPSGDFLSIRTSGSRFTPHGYVYTQYQDHEVDYLIAYCGELDRCFALPVAMFREHFSLQLRLTPTRNGQRACINIADDFAFPGPVAQLGEHSAGSRKVRGSIPLRSTEETPVDRPALVVKANPFRDHLGYWMDTVAEGQEIIVTRHGKPRLRLSPVEPEPHQEPLFEPVATMASVAATAGHAELWRDQEAA